MTGLPPWDPAYKPPGSLRRLASWIRPWLSPAVARRRAGDRIWCLTRCWQISPGTENTWLSSRCEGRRWHKGRHGPGQYGETWAGPGATDLAGCIPHRNDDPALPHPDGYHPAPGSRPPWWPGGHPDEAAWEREMREDRP
jgi:hypothetical protein